MSASMQATLPKTGASHRSVTSLPVPYAVEHAAASAHPLQQNTDRTVRGGTLAERLEDVAMMYGSAVAMRIKCELIACDTTRRCDAMVPSRDAARQTVLGVDCDITFDDVLNLPQDRPDEPEFKVHDSMAVQYGLW